MSLLERASNWAWRSSTTFDCCDGREPCDKSTLLEAVRHAPERADATGCNQSTQLVGGVWRTVEESRR